MEKYDNCFSLGWFCGTASSLSKLGLRNSSGPFDWCFSDFDSVINQIDEEFADFMTKKNLEIIENKPKEFRDTKYNFYFNHDIEENFETEYINIYDKYMRRANRFIENIKSPTCFFRAIRSEREIEYIVNNSNYIERVLKKYNSRNSIVYILLNNMSLLPDNFKWFRLSLDQYEGKTYEMRNMFNQSEELLQFCETLLDSDQIESNKQYDMKKNRQKDAAAEINYYVCNNIDGIDKIFLDVFHLQNDEPFYIWGGGGYGIPLYYYLIKRNIKIKAIIDNRKQNEFPNDILVVSPNDVEPHSKIFIAIANEISNYEVKEQIKMKKCKILTYKELLYGIE